MTSTSSRSRVINQNIKPIVLLLDLDRTMIGDIVPQSEEFHIIKDINYELKILDKKTISFNFKRLQKELRENIIRSYLLKSLNLVRSYNNIEIALLIRSPEEHGTTPISQTWTIGNRPINTNDNYIRDTYSTSTLVRNLYYE